MAKKVNDAATVDENADGVEYSDTDTNGQGRIPGTEVPVVKAIQKFVIRHEETKAAHKELTAQLIAENAEAIELYRKHESVFSEDERGNYVYSDKSGAYLEIAKPGELKVKTKMLDTEVPF
jgi:hypothetical protein